ncbi:hypothetical protein P280DRAFT_539299 [Massarina eburnea CBS 473.64]|uniref:Major facilitator superfamily (MFS) profile domain-containing protein n=1 Tax=Massarina eburnea CBS 473.64 TaxID=1395130 RepID=A0A6A6S997_9PLEO|nr:hypothetical protein P280DRAFT_539299 [Massarina eburnea CBS 473.64]
MGTFTVNLEISLASTSLVFITDDLKSFSQSSWVVTAYLLTYTSSMLIMAKLSDLYGRKMTLLFSVHLHGIFRGLLRCLYHGSTVRVLVSNPALAHHILIVPFPDSIVCRAFQGIGGCGVYSVVMVVIFEMVQPTKYSV